MRFNYNVKISRPAIRQVCRAKNNNVRNWAQFSLIIVKLANKTNELSATSCNSLNDDMQISNLVCTSCV